MKALNEDNRGKNRMATNMAIVGCGAGLAIFAIYGLLNASLIGGLVGLNIAGAIIGSPVEATLVAKVIITLSMLAGVTVAALTFSLVGVTLGWVAGKAIEIVSHTGRYANWVHEHMPHATVKH